MLAVCHKKGYVYEHRNTYPENKQNNNLEYCCNNNGNGGMVLQIKRMSDSTTKI